MSRYAIARALLGALLATGCPRKSTENAAPSAECRKFGESCLFAPGKLGVCLERTSCPAGERCFTCQSQH
ncbi:MAG TPA: hypothetical protein VMS65_13470 [Polyangiaceae bacterium]|nr:hypothetical protein [Polyangiaceae bacterium]